MQTGQQNGDPAPRVSLNVVVECRRTYAREAGNAQIKNISLTGALIEQGQTELNPQDKVHLLFRVSGRTRRLQATVIWTREKLAGVCFTPQNKRDIQIIDDFIYFIEEQKTNRKSVLEDIFKRVG